MASVTINLDSSGFQEKTKKYAVNVRAKMQESAPIILATIIADILSRTPSPERELSLIMYGEEGQGGLPVTNVRQSSNNKGRTPFVREPGMWLQEAIQFEGVNRISPQGFSIQIGNQALLEQITKFSWINYSKQMGEIEHTTNYGMYGLFEYGSNVLGFGQVKPAFGSNYYLTPGDYTRIPVMDKTIPPFGMYTHINSFAMVEIIKEKIREVQF